MSRVTFDFEFPLAAPPRELKFAHTMLQEFAYAPNTPWDVTYDFRLKRADSKEQMSDVLRMGGVFAWPAALNTDGEQGQTNGVRRMPILYSPDPIRLTHPAGKQNDQSLLTP